MPWLVKVCDYSRHLRRMLHGLRTSDMEHKDADLCVIIDTFLKQLRTVKALLE